MSEPRKLKILIVGLDTVGKTSIIRRVFNNEDLGYLLDVQPTRGVDREVVDVGESQLIIWDLGGQQSYRNKYIQDFSMFYNTDLLIFVIDMQDRERIEESIDYLKNILNICRETSDSNNVSVLLHKSDPDAIGHLRSDIFKLTKEIKGLKHILEDDIKVYTSSIFVETLDYAFEKILADLDINLSLREKQKIAPNVYLGEVEKEKREVTETPQGRSQISGLEFLKNFLTLQNMATSLSFDEFHQQMIELFDERSNLASQDMIIKQFMEPFKILLLRYSLSRIEQQKEVGNLDEVEIELISLVLGQINLLKIPIFHYITEVSLNTLKSKISFGDSILELLLSLIVSSYLMEVIETKEFLTLHNMIKSKEKIRFVDQYTPNLSINDHKETNLSGDPTKFFIEQKQVEVNMMLNAYIQEQDERLERSTLVKDEKERIRLFQMQLELLKMQFWYYVENQNLTDFEIFNLVKTRFHKISDELLQAARVMQVITVEERNILTMTLKQI